MNRIRQLRQSLGIKQIDFCKQLGVTQSALSGWESGKYEPSFASLQTMCEIFNVSYGYLLGKENSPYDTETAIRVPVLGEVRGGIPIEAIQEILDYEEITPEMAHQGDHFGLRVTGDSMEPKFSPGDVVIVRKQPDVESGDFAVVYVDGDFATVKKIIKNGTSIMLVPLNNNYAPTVYTEPEIMSIPVTILGKVVELRAKFK